MSTYREDDTQRNGWSFRTTDLQLATYLLAASRVRFLRCEAPGVTSRLVEFVFDDPEGCSDSFKAEFQAGAECSAVGLFDAQRRLRRMVDEVLGRRGGGR